MSSRTAMGEAGPPARVSIVTINRNDVKGLERTLRSIRALRAAHALEQVIVDGASTDGSLELIGREAAAGPGTVVVSEPDTGIYDAMNKGIAAATGESDQAQSPEDPRHLPCLMMPGLLEWLPQSVVLTDQACRISMYNQKAKGLVLGSGLAWDDLELLPEDQAWIKSALLAYVQKPGTPA